MRKSKETSAGDTGKSHASVLPVSFSHPPPPFAAPSSNLSHSLQPPSAPSHHRRTINPTIQRPCQTLLRLLPEHVFCHPPIPASDTSLFLERVLILSPISSSSVCPTPQYYVMNPTIVSHTWHQICEVAPHILLRLPATLTWVVTTLTTVSLTITPLLPWCPSD
ncbi:hypothetical protein M405DRAFT_181396 [Rhizopogon salebrosus TDB-379]|nr:hypothetical protein M405DRAFT_181396 [Rhizopogon salebrosus TDB-379]